MAAKKPTKKAAPKEPQNGLEDLVIEQDDGASALFTLGKEVRRVRQDDLVRAGKKISAAVQLTY